jgi:hypothetical protein
MGYDSDQHSAEASVGSDTQRLSVKFNLPTLHSLNL